MSSHHRDVDVTTAAPLLKWAYQKRAMFIGMEGYPTASIVAKFKDEQSAAGAGEPRRRQRWLEVYYGDGLIVQRIVVTLSYLPRMALACYYLFRGPWHRAIREQCEAIGCTRTQYWPALEAGEEAVSSGLKLLENLSDNAHPVNSRAGA